MRRQSGGLHHGCKCRGDAAVGVVATRFFLAARCQHHGRKRREQQEFLAICYCHIIAFLIITYQFPMLSVCHHGTAVDGIPVGNRGGEYRTRGRFHHRAVQRDGHVLVGIERGECRGKVAVEGDGGGGVAGKADFGV